MSWSVILELLQEYVKLLSLITLWVFCYVASCEKRSNVVLYQCSQGWRSDLRVAWRDEPTWNDKLDLESWSWTSVLVLRRPTYRLLEQVLPLHKCLSPVVFRANFSVAFLPPSLLPSFQGDMTELEVPPAVPSDSRRLQDLLIVLFVYLPAFSDFPVWSFISHFPLVVCFLKPSSSFSVLFVASLLSCSFFYPFDDLAGCSFASRGLCVPETRLPPPPSLCSLSS